MTTAFDPIDLAGTKLSNRIAMAPMTRNRVGSDGVPTETVATYYAQRASAGLIISEAINLSTRGQRYPKTPGLYNEAQIAGWRRVTDAVHDAGSRIYAQVMHSGRIGHPSVLPGDLVPVGPSAVAAQGRTKSSNGGLDYVTPKELTEEEIHQIIADFATAARNAITAGFDGVEVHGAYGFLIHQFLSSNANLRTDDWGDTVEGRIRFAVEATKAVVAAIGADRTGLRISPGVTYNDIVEDNAHELYAALVDAIEPLGLAYLHIAEGTDRALTLRIRERFSGVLVLNPFTEGRPTGETELHLVEDGVADVLSFGALFLANPDLPARLRAGGPYNTPDPSTFYGGDTRGYTDYPTLEQS